jgi:hypothetical protein
MTAAGVPENGDVMIRRDGPNATSSYVISAIPGPDEVACATLAEAVSMARSYAEHARVNLWLARVGNEFTLRVRFRGAERPKAHGVLNSTVASV